VSECVFIGSLPSTGHGADNIENASSFARMRAYLLVAFYWAWLGPHVKHFFQYLLLLRARISDVA
jgi:hypothetical protein